MRKHKLISDLKEVAKGVALLHQLEESLKKKEHLDIILRKILGMIEILEAGDNENLNGGDNDNLLTQIWNEVANNFIKYGLGELFERLLEFGADTYRV